MKARKPELTETRKARKQPQTQIRSLNTGTLNPNLSLERADTKALL